MSGAKQFEDLIAWQSEHLIREADLKFGRFDQACEAGGGIKPGAERGVSRAQPQVSSQQPSEPAPAGVSAQ